MTERVPHGSLRDAIVHALHLCDLQEHRLIGALLANALDVLDRGSDDGANGE